MVGLLVQYLDNMGTKKRALFEGEKAQENSDRFFATSTKEEFISSVTATNDMQYDHVIIDEWTTPYYGSNPDMPSCVIK